MNRYSEPSVSAVETLVASGMRPQIFCKWSPWRSLPAGTYTAFLDAWTVMKAPDSTRDRSLGDAEVALGEQRLETDPRLLHILPRPFLPVDRRDDRDHLRPRLAQR